MEYKMILATADLKTIYAVMVAKRKAPVAQVAEQRTRKPQVGFSINSWCSKIKEAFHGQFGVAAAGRRAGG